MTNARDALRSGTRQAHTRVDNLYSRADLSHRRHYARFLMAQAAALIPIEEALKGSAAVSLVANWPPQARSKLVRADLLALGVPVPTAKVTPVFATIAEVWGALYVLEGSRLGGSLLLRRVTQGFPTAFLAAPRPRGGWRTFLERLDESLVERAGIALALSTATLVFDLFERTGWQFLESDQDG